MSSSIVNTLVSIPSIIISILDYFSTPTNISTVGPIQIFTTSPAISTIVSIPKSKAVIPKVEPKPSLKLLITGKEIDEDIDLDKEIEIPKIDFNTATVGDVRMVSQILE